VDVAHLGRKQQVPLILRIEITVNDLIFFKHYREVEHRDASGETKMGLYAENHLPRQPCANAGNSNRRYMELIPGFGDPTREPVARDRNVFTAPNQ
jgi:hypothetical protein